MWLRRLAHAPLGIPKNAIAVATIDPPSFFAMFPSARTEIESELDLPAGALQSLDAFGYDTKRATTVAVPALSDDERKIVEEMKPLAAAHAPTDQVVELGKRAAKTITSEVRILFPATDTKKLESALGAAMLKDHWKQNGRVFTTRHAVAEFSDDGSWLALDLDIEHSKGSLDTLHATFANARETPPTLDGLAFRASYDPNAVAEFGVLVGVTKTVGAVSGESIDADQRRRIMAEGVFEAEQLVGLAGNMFDRIEITGRMQPFETMLRAHAAGYTPAPAPLWANAPSPRVDGSTLTLDASRAFVNTMGSAHDLMERMRNGGSISAIVALPRILLTAPLIAPKAANVAAPDDVLQDHFERTGISWSTSHSPMFVGLLPATATRVTAECALSLKTPCDAKKKLKLGVAVPMDDGQAKLVQVDKRFVVLTSGDAAALAAPVKLTPAGPVRFDLDTAPLAAILHTQLALPPHLNGEVTNDAGSLVIKVK